MLLSYQNGNVLVVEEKKPFKEKTRVVLENEANSGKKESNWKIRAPESQISNSAAV